jgi:heat shock protein HslJ
LAASIAGCGLVGSPGPSQNLSGTEWNLVEMDGHPPLAEGGPLTIGFENGDHVGGNSGCNSYGGVYAVDGSSMVISDLVSTLRACAGPLNEQEAEFLRALGEAAAYEISNGRLMLKDGGGTVLVFTRA